MAGDDATTTLPSLKQSLGGPRDEPAPQLFLCLEAERLTSEPLCLPLDPAVSLELGRGGQRRLVSPTPADSRLSLADQWMSSRHARLWSVAERWMIEDLGSRNGTWVNGVRVGQAQLADGDLLELGHSLFRFRSALPQAPAMPIAPLPSMITWQAGFARRLDQLEATARSKMPVLVVGETGTGKEIVARGIHQVSRRPGPFVAVNCGALPDTLVEAELFGYRRGAFSGAVTESQGFLRAADGGTLFLDEIGDLSPAGQVAVLRALQEEEVVPLGTARPVRVDLRLVAATNRDLEAMVAEGRFREDLYARLHGFVMRLPPLRERREDLALLIPALLARIAPGVDRGAWRLDVLAARALWMHDWPLNVRELLRALEGAVVLADGGTIDLEHLPESVRLRKPRPRPMVMRSAPARPPRPATARTTVPELAVLDAEELARRARLAELLRASGGNVSAVARAMGKARVQIRRWLKRYQLDPSTFGDAHDPSEGDADRDDRDDGDDGDDGDTGGPERV